MKQLLTQLYHNGVTNFRCFIKKEELLLIQAIALTPEFLYNAHYGKKL